MSIRWARPMKARNRPQTIVRRVTVKPVKLSAIHIDAGTQTRARIDEATATDYAEAMLAGDRFPPVVVFQNDGTLILADGFHRVRAAKIAKRETILAEVRPGARTDALKHSLAANHRHGLRRTNEDKQHAVIVALQEFAHLSDRLIAELCGVTHPVVGKLRRQLANFTSCALRTGKDGKARRLPIPAAPSLAAWTPPAAPPLGRKRGVNAWLDQIHLGDCRDLLKQLPDGCIDALITDASFGVGQGHWDVMNAELAAVVVREALRVLKPTGSFFWFGSNEKTAELWPVFKPLRPRWLTWFYRNSSNIRHRTFGWNSQVIVYGHNGQPVFNLDAARVPYSENTCTTRISHDDSSSQFGIRKNGRCIKSYHPQGRKPMDVLEFPAVTAGVAQAEGRWHPAQKPLALMRLLVAVSTNSGGVVLDPFAGGGTTCLAARQLGRHFIGFEREPDFACRARQRLSVNGAGVA